MSLDSSESRNENTYAIDTENAAEMTRLLRQDRLITHTMGGLFPERTDLVGIQRILDIASGPGGWGLEVAFANPDIQVTGIDISQTMVQYARAQAKVQGLDNAHFMVMNALKPLDFPDGSFDLVNARATVGFMLPGVWPAYIQECLRILRPGGIVRLVEGEWGLANTPAVEKYCLLINQAFQRIGQSFSPNGVYIGMTPVLARSLRKAGCHNVQKQAYAIEISSGTEAHDGYCEDLEVVFKLVQPFVTKTKVATQEALDELYQQALIEMRQDEFCALWFGLIAWGEKPL